MPPASGSLPSVEPWERTLQDRWDDFERFFESDWEGDEPGARLVEAVEALVDDWWDVAADTVVAELTQRPRLRLVIAVCDFDRRVPAEVADRLYAAAER
jgi:hypothetical protein